jgi:hypothetical protein
MKLTAQQVLDMNGFKCQVKGLKCHNNHQKDQCMRVMNKKCHDLATDLQ